ncbi:hypothetical protein GNI_172800 [Gregarina niphandrodes]|uniref:Uncharacterized protein n=1 Tax=Gregarina niphandrodes TaxID=110365 RepID=A0A023AYS7_GRENI|nr:hypothetical protein GNI_172800 [Gregarina niphandrodes]EZG43425.1 hypothetical protein GNI_172800 [Gregarina niphandrodes]|eukprot:XP_011133345.1 hypothetical protein GNI_172800 [Gregarina niphandrodes]
MDIHYDNRWQPIIYRALDLKFVFDSFSRRDTTSTNGFKEITTSNTSASEVLVTHYISRCNACSESLRAYA